VLTERNVVELKNKHICSKLTCFIKHMEEGDKRKSIMFIEG